MALNNSIDSQQTLDSSSTPTFAGVNTPAINAGSGADETITLGDAAGANKLSVVDSAAAEVAFIDSDGNAALLDSLTIGQAEVETSFTISGVATTAQLSVDAIDTDAQAEAIIHRHNDTSVYGAYEILMRSRGTHDTPTIVQNGDGLGTVFFGGYDGTAWSLGGMIQCDVSGTPGVNDMPSKMVFGTTADGANFPTTALTIDNAQEMIVANDLWIGTSAPTVPGSFNIEKTVDGDDVEGEIRNNSNTASSDALLGIVVGGSSAGDPFLTYNVPLVQSWSHGIDNSNSDAFVISASAALGTTDVIVATTAGEVTLPLQPAFSATATSGAADVTGDGTGYTIVYNNELYDRGTDWDGTTFTAPVTGVYHFDLCVLLAQIGAGHTYGYCTLTHTAVRTYYGNICNPAAAAGNATISMQLSVDILMTQGDTVTTTVVVSNSTKTVDIDATSAGTFFNGRLVA